ncbi:MAG: hypothetical protein K6G56_04055, partial [Clostridiales bacterium]|nr:hypothetical protein [Clostridiales bacterium]
MKKFLALLVSALMVMGMIPFTAVAATTGEAHFTVDTVDNANPGDTVNVFVNLSGTYEAHIINLSVNYDPEQLECTGVKKGDLLKEEDYPEPGMYMADYTTQPGRVAVSVMYASEALTNAEGQFVKLIFNVKEDCTVAHNVLELVVEEVSYMPLGTSNTEPVPYTAENGAINVNVPDPTEPPVEPTEPPVEPTEPPVEPTEPPVEPTEPPVEPTEPPVEPTEPPVEPTEPPVEPTEPPVEPTEPPVEPTEPPVEPTEPPVEPTEEPGENGLIAGYYFETQAQVDEWTFIGANGSNWLWSVNNPGAYDYTEYAHEG